MSVDASKLLQHLNPAQRRAVQSDADALLVIAGAGTGKTRVLTHRIAHLINQGMAKPEAICAVTFTNKAASEMVERIHGLTLGMARGITMGTFHRICARLLRDWPLAHPYGDNFAIYDTSEQLAALKQGMREVDLDPKTFQPSALLNRISHHKSQGLTLERFQEEVAGNAYDFRDEQLIKLFPRYQAKLRAARALDFDDLIIEGTRLLLEHADVRAEIRRRYRWVFVDEFQDINQAQWELIKAIAGTPEEAPHARLFCVGDDDQAIYGFRGAHAGFLDDFQSTYHPELILLEDNYRSTAQILTVANQVLASKAWGPLKTLRASSPDGPKPWASLASSDVEEALEVGREIERLLRTEGYAHTDCAVLYRRNAQSRVFEEVFARLAIPHQVIGGQRFYQRQEIKDVVAYFRLLHNDRDAAALDRAITAPRRGIGDKTILQLQNVLERHDIGLRALMEHPEYLSEFPTRARVGVGSFIELMDQLSKHAARMTLPDLLTQILELSGYSAALRASKAIEDEARLDNLEELHGALTDYSESYPDHTLGDWLAEQALVADTDSLDAVTDQVTLMTLHAAKGLEFRAVFLVGLEEGLLPHFRALDEGTLDEELRLAYVGITRAKERLYLAAAQVRRHQGSLMQSAPSRFWREFSKDALEGAPIHLAYLLSELGGDGWSQEGGMKWRRGLMADRALADSYGGARRSAGSEWEVETMDLAEPLPGERSSRALSARLGDGRERPAASSSVSRAASPVKVSAPPTAYAIGEVVTHAVWGAGRIKEITPAGSDNFLSIEFPEIGLKMLAESKAPLTKS